MTVIPMRAITLPRHLIKNASEWLFITPRPCVCMRAILHNAVAFFFSAACPYSVASLNHNQAGKDSCQILIYSPMKEDFS